MLNRDVCVHYILYTFFLVNWALRGSQLKDHKPVSARSRKILSLEAYYSTIINSTKPCSLTPGKNGKHSYNEATQKAFVQFVLWGENFLIINSKTLLQRFSTIKTSINYAAWSQLVYRVPLKNYDILGCQRCVCK